MSVREQVKSSKTIQRLEPILIFATLVSEVGLTEIKNVHAMGSTWRCHRTGELRKDHSARLRDGGVTAGRTTTTPLRGNRRRQRPAAEERHEGGRHRLARRGPAARPGAAISGTAAGST